MTAHPRRNWRNRCARALRDWRAGPEYRDLIDPSPHPDGRAQMTLPVRVCMAYEAGYRAALDQR